ncbi:hypothetical protein B4U79_05763 [Dinothrombium tinctorium]|uniref:Uncharacterized protein n=1 Tax=Dinothrombium tinctorium TaxID=1965070 RepID=A0A3S3NYT4_9ACAR|nr:hypothetical protein B4U79_05763 [Dinothrombium tinctorium]
MFHFQRAFITARFINQQNRYQEITRAIFVFASVETSFVFNKPVLRQLITVSPLQ